jgi:hypothetical protein
MSAEGRQRIIDAAKARWARIRGEEAAAAALTVTKGNKGALAANAPPKGSDFKSKMSIAMKKAWAKRRRQATKK